MLEFRTTGFSGYSTKFSPFFADRFAVAGSANFGLVGNGRLYTLGLGERGIVQENFWDTQDSLYDLAWSESNENHLVTAGGDGSVKLFDISAPKFPIATYAEHGREAFSVSWNQLAKDTFISSSWDGTIKLWNPLRTTSLLTLPVHSCTYSAAFSPHSNSIITSVSSDSHLRVFDLRTPASASNHLVQLVAIHGSLPFTGLGGNPRSNTRQVAPPSEALTHDHNKYREGIVAVGGVDQLIRVFDLRATREPISVLKGHEYAVRRVAWSPHMSDVLLSASYDMSVRVWTDGEPIGAPPGTVPPGAFAREMGRMDRHTEFVTGIDWCIFGSEGWVASAGWDQKVYVYDVREILHHRI